MVRLTQYEQHPLGGHLSTMLDYVLTSSSARLPLSVIYRYTSNAVVARKSVYSNHLRKFPLL